MIELLLCTLIWGASFLFQKLGADHLGPYSINCTRNLLAGAFLAGCMLVRRAPFSLSRDTAVGGALSGVILFAAMMAQQLGIEHTSPAVSAFLTANYVLLVPVFGVALGRRAGVGVWLGVALALGGTFLICFMGEASGSLALGLGEAWTLACAACFAVQILVVDRFAARCDMLGFSMVQMTVAGMIALPFMWMPSELSKLTAEGLSKGWLSIVFLGVFSSGIAYTLQNLGQKKVPAALASIVMSLESVFAAFFGWIFFGDLLTPLQLVGCAAVLAAVIVAQLWSAD